MPSSTSHYRRRSSLTTTLVAVLCLSLAACTTSVNALPTSHLPLPAVRHYQLQAATQPSYVPSKTETKEAVNLDAEDEDDEDTKRAEAMAKSRIMMRRRRAHP